MLCTQSEEIIFQSKTDYTTLVYEVTAETTVVSYNLGFTVYFDSPVAQKDFASFATALTTSWQASFMAESKLFGLILYMYHYLVFDVKLMVEKPDFNRELVVLALTVIRAEAHMEVKRRSAFAFA